MLQVRNVPDDLHAELRARAARSRLSLSEYVLRESQAVAARPSKTDVLARAARRGGRMSFDEAVAAVSAGRPDEAWSSSTRRSW
ncbi:FitA-like ribbon-helix-helix domain-containing protein [Geodermatophilus sp. SYSU D00766]